MVNFRPENEYICFLLEKLIKKHEAKEPFLDIGCGKGDFSLFFAKKGFQGKAIDISEEAIKETIEKLKSLQINVERKELENEEGKYNTIILFDILEHVPNSRALLQEATKRLNKEGTIIVSVPIGMKEWRWDDEVYGHYRRFEIKEISKLLEEEGFKVLESWDYTFPIYWALRRMYTKTFNKSNNLKTMNERTTESAFSQPWARGKATKMFVTLFPWKLSNYFMFLFRKSEISSGYIIIGKKVQTE